MLKLRVENFADKYRETEIELIDFIKDPINLAMILE
jgi:hypothetical protein